jgi:hypothetical protein
MTLYVSEWEVLFSINIIMLIYSKRFVSVGHGGRVNLTIIWQEI